MNTTDQISSTEESLLIITRMIERTQQSIRGGSFHFIMWGWVVILAYLGHYALERFTDFPYPYAIWSIAIPAWIVSMVYGRRHARKERVTTYAGSLIMWTWIGFTVSIVILIFSGLFFLWLNGLILLFAGLATFTTGLIIRYKPLIVGGSLLWIFAAVAFSVPYLDSFLVSALAVVCGYLVPGYMLKNSKN